VGLGCVWRGWGGWNKASSSWWGQRSSVNDYFIEHRRVTPKYMSSYQKPENHISFANAFARYVVNRLEHSPTLWGCCCNVFTTECMDSQCFVFLCGKRLRRSVILSCATLASSVYVICFAYSVCHWPWASLPLAEC
jgi:hypothetical protein